MKMYELFIRNNESNISRVLENKNLREDLDTPIKMLFDECGGCSFKNGLYRIHTFKSSFYWSELIGNYFTKYKTLLPFGYDWMGRQFAINKNIKDYILMFDPATAEEFELNQNLISFHNDDLVNERESILSESLFDKVKMSLQIKDINYNDCCGYKIPLFLNGTDTLTNYETLNMEVYWQIQRQIYFQIKDLPSNTKINSINFE